MINITDKHNCCGCGACAQKCPKQCISLQEDNEGFLYPKVDTEICVNCGLCEKVCPVVNQNKPRKPIKVYAAINPNDEIRLNSSSGGIFTMLAERTIDEGGIVFGARFDEYWEVVHDYVETKEEIEAFRGSKYVQSSINNTYKQVEEFLKDGRKVLFSGTPCQIAGLNCFLRKDYTNLLTVDVACHGVPSPMVWREYLKELLESPQKVINNSSIPTPLREKSLISSISFRDKSTGWKRYSLVIRQKSYLREYMNMSLPSEIYLHETLDKNEYMQIFLNNLCLRPSCNSCPSKQGKSCSDITIADYWKYKEYENIPDDDKGVSLVLINSQKGNNTFGKLNVLRTLSNYEDALLGNPVLENSVNRNQYIDEFWSLFRSNRFKDIPLLLRRIKRNKKLTSIKNSIVEMCPKVIISHIKKIIK